ncbi:phage tail protein [Brucella sp. MAB-22]|uniref:phage tail-collar fiber domain-containing protein n=1 Tax=Brucella sp. MAB-22 TaxID=2986424 RepID=UPI00221FB4C8|nr:phage tail protein [Brucella sp. MAB-22]UYT57766.1 phage tail protein [Brucella sp. MAB-22]
MAQNTFALMTNLGRAKEAAALANGTSVVITHIAIGDGTTVPSGGETALYHEVARKAISGHGTVVGASNVAYFDIFLEAAEGPYTIREAGLIDQDGDLIAIARYDPPINKPVPASGQTVEGTVRLEVAFSNLANVTIIVDPSFTIPLQRVSRLPWLPVVSMSVTAPPASPAIGDVYLVPTGATGAWAGQSGKIAEYTTAGWAILTPPNGHGVSLPDGRVYERVGGAYVEKFAIDVQTGKWLYVVAEGTVNALTASLIPAPPALVAGLSIKIKAIGANTGAVTLNLNSLGAKAVVRASGGALQKNDIVAGQIVELVYDGAAFQISNLNPALLPTRSSRTFNTVGTQAWVVPDGVYSVRVRLWGGGGGGGGAAAGAAAAGGAGGGYAEGTYAVVPGQSINVTVGAGGTRGNATVWNGGTGGTSSFGTMISAMGGGGGGGAATSGVIGNGAQGGGASGGQFSVGGQPSANAYFDLTPKHGSGGAGSYGTSGTGMSVSGGLTASYPGGGGGGGAGNSQGGLGSDGLVVLEW